jgi:glycosyltransferase involved in cell wall biosynthesis
MKLLSICIPVYNEEEFINKCVQNIIDCKKLGLDFEIIISDGNSTDRTRSILKKLNHPNVKCFFRDSNDGKGSNILNALSQVSKNSDIVLFQDADLEYSPDDYEDLLKPIISGYADIVYGTRFARAKPFHVYSLIHNIANLILTQLINILFNRSFSDVLTGYKVFKKSTLDDLNLSSLGYDIETEITAKISKNKTLKIYEVPIAIYSRRYSEGKKIHWWHTFLLILSVFKWRIFK